MVEQIKAAFSNIKEYWEKQTPKTKKIVIIAAAGVVALAVMLTFALNAYNGGYTILYEGIDAKESRELYATLQNMNVPAQINAQGEVMVPKNEADKLLLELSALGYPQTALSYNIFSSNTGFTTTEFEKKQYLLFDLQDRIQNTLMKLDGVKGAVVTLDVPQESSYVWENNDTKSSASVLLTMYPGYRLSGEKVSAIKNLVAAAVPKMEAASVTVVDSATGIEMRASEETAGSSELGYNLQRLGFEYEVEKRLEEKVLNLLTMGYGTDRVRVSATVVIDYDKMITEEMQYIPEDNGLGVKGSIDESYTMDPSKLSSGVVGEENNTDVPIYVDRDNDGTPEYINHTRNVDYLVSYIKRQIEKDKAELKEASIAVVVNDPNLTAQKKEYLIETVSKAVNIDPSNISVNNFDFVDEPVPTFNIIEVLTSSPLYMGIAAGVVAMIIIILLLIFRKKEPEEDEAQAEAKEGLTLLDVHSDIEERKKKILETAKLSTKNEDAITNEIRDFSASNPEITASLIRSWLKEDE